MASRSSGKLLEASTRDLLGEVRRGREDAKEALYRRYSDRLSRWARGRLPPAARELVETDDVVQDTLARSLRHVEQFEPHHDGAFQAYLRRAVLNRIRDETRKSRRAPRRDGTASDLVDARTISPLERAVGLERLAGELEASRRAARGALEIQNGVFQLAAAGVELARSGFVEEAAALREDLAEDSSRPLFDGAASFVEGEILLAENRPREAVEALRRAAVFPGSAPEAALARALAEAGEAEEAFSRLGEIVTEPARLWQQNILDRTKLPPGFFRESLFFYARLARELDRTDEARNLLTSFVSLDEGPDTEALLKSLKE